MDLNFQPPTALEYFQSLVGHDVAFPLLEAAISLAQDVDPALDIQSILLEVDALSVRALERIPRDATAMQRLYLLNEFFYEKLGFAVNANDFTDPANSYLHRVLHTRRGIPISLAVLWMELAAGVGLANVQGVSFPGHFLVKVTLAEGIIVQDPLTGRGLTPAMLAEHLEPFQQSWGVAQDEMPPLHLFLQPASSSDILERMLRNLQSIYEQSKQWSCLLGVQQRLILLRPDDAVNYRDRASVLVQLARHSEALEDLQTYVYMAKDPLDLQQVQAQMEQIKASL